MYVIVERVVFDMKKGKALLKRIGKHVVGGIKSAKGDTRGVTTVEVILVLVVLLAIVVIFREQLTAIVTNIFSHVNSTVNELYG